MEQFTFKNLSKLFLLAFVAQLFLAGCLEGPAGKDGKDGEDGVDGENAVFDSTLLTTAQECKTCHNESTGLKAKQLQWGSSGHATLGDFERSTASCAGCHTSEGFHERLETGEAVAEKDVLDPTPQNCRTCHFIHTEYDSTDYALRVDPEDDVLIHLTGDELNFGSGNVCATCHQPRLSYAIPEPGGDDYEITSSRFGPHYGTQATTLKGVGGSEIPGSVAYKNSKHATLAKNACVDCHMATAFGDNAGGHQLSLSYEYHGGEEAHLVGCVECHEDEVEDFNFDDVGTKIQELMDTLIVRLQEAGALDSNGGTVSGTYSAEVAGALWNLRTLQEDKSGGNHNFPYANALLSNSIEALEE